jgi:hypothetical protein
MICQVSGVAVRSRYDVQEPPFPFVIARCLMQDLERFVQTCGSVVE